MGVDVVDGVLLGIVSSDKAVREVYNDADKHEEIISLLDNIVKLNNEDGEGVFQDNNPYNDGKTSLYLGIFWVWSSRRALRFDDYLTKLYIEDPKSQETIIKEEKYKRLQQRIYETLVNFSPSIKQENVRFYHVRYWS